MRKTVSQIGLGWMIAILLGLWVLGGLADLPSWLDTVRHVVVVVGLVILVTWGVNKGKKERGPAARA